MNLSWPRAFAAATHPLFVASTIYILGMLSARYWRNWPPFPRFLTQAVILVVFTGFLLAAGVAPYRPLNSGGPEWQRLLIVTLDITWWFAVAWGTMGFLRAFVTLGSRPGESRLVQDLIAGLVYLGAGVAIVGNVFDLPVKGLLATSGALAIIIGLALQSSLADLFSGIVLNIERPYRVGDWILLEDTLQGEVLELNWRSTRILTGTQDVAIIPNSVIAKAKLTNCSSPTKMHAITLRVKLGTSVAPGAARDLIREVLLSTSRILQVPAPKVTIKDLSAEMIDCELFYAVSDMSVADGAQNEIFDRLYRAASAARVSFAPRTAGAKAPDVNLNIDSAPSRLLSGISIFSTLTAQERETLATKMERRDFKPGDVIAGPGTVLQSLFIVNEGVLVGSRNEDGCDREIVRLARGEYFGEGGLLTEEPLTGQLTALTKVSLFVISKQVFLPILQARPGLAEELTETLARRHLARQTVVNNHDAQAGAGGPPNSVAAGIRRLFSLQ